MPSACFDHAAGLTIFMTNADCVHAWHSARPMTRCRTCRGGDGHRAARGAVAGAGAGRVADGVRYPAQAGLGRCGCTGAAGGVSDCSAPCDAPWSGFVDAPPAGSTGGPGDFAAPCDAPRPGGAEGAGRGDLAPPLVAGAPEGCGAPCETDLPGASGRPPPCETARPAPRHTPRPGAVELRPGCGWRGAAGPMPAGGPAAPCPVGAAPASPGTELPAGEA
jgi:hypothetical protein